MEDLIMAVTQGRAWVFGDKVPTDAITPNTILALPFEEMAKVVLKVINPDFAPNVKPGDVLVAGKNFGCSSGRTFAPKALKATKIGAIVVESVSRTFYRNAHECGLGFVLCPDITKHVKDGDKLEVDTETGLIINHTSGEKLQGEVAGGMLAAMVRMGGLLPLLESPEGEEYRKMFEAD
jgi:3-isopropylmalate/(R)-2-methylmalate dehydratase small subunit